MNWKLIFGLSLYGVAMAFVADHLSSNIMLFSQLVISLLCAYVIAKKAHGKYFLHGFLVSLIGCIWITLVNFALSKHYDPNPYWIIIVIVLGISFGLFSFIASKIIKHPIT